MLNRHLLTLLACAFALIAVPVSAATVIEDKDWLYGEQGTKAIEYAKEHNRPIVLLMAARETNCPKCVNGAQATIRTRTHRDMVRVMYYFGNAKNPVNPINSPEVRALANKVSRETGDFSLSMTAYFTPQGDLIGYVPYERIGDLDSQSKLAFQIHTWVSKVPGEVSSADRLAERGQYDRALALIAKIMEQDAKISHLIQKQIGKVKEDAEMPETPVSLFFAGLSDDKLEEYKEQAQAKLQEVKDLISEDKVREAQRGIRALARTPEAFEMAEQIDAVREEIEEKLRNARN